MQRPIALVDLDDTFLDLSSNLCRSLNYHTGKDIEVSEWSSFDLSGLYGIDDDKFFKCIIGDYLLQEAAPFPGAIASLSALSDSHDIVICTSRGYHPDAKFITTRWLAHHFVQYDELIIVENGMSKADAYELRKLPVPDVVFDDAIHNAKSLIGMGVPEVWMNATPWNVDLWVNPGRYTGFGDKCRRRPGFRDCVNEYLNIFESKK